MRETGSSDRRPWQLVMSVGLFSATWLTGLGALMAFAAPWAGGVEPGDVGGMIGLALWTLLVIFLLYRLWRGGPIAWWLMSQLGMGLGAIQLLGVATIWCFLLPEILREETEFNPLFLAGPICATALLSAGVLLRSRPARAWCGRAASTDATPGPSLFDRTGDSIADRIPDAGGSAEVPARRPQ